MLTGEAEESTFLDLDFEALGIPADGVTERWSGRSSRRSSRWTTALLHRDATGRRLFGAEGQIPQPRVVRGRVSELLDEVVAQGFPLFTLDDPADLLDAAEREYLAAPGGVSTRPLPRYGCRLTERQIAAFSS